MANSLDNIAPLLLQEALLALRENAITPRLVNVNYSPEPTEPGTPIRIPIPRPATAYNVNAGTAGTSTDINPRKVEIVTTTWRGTNFELNDQEFTEIMNGSVPMQLSEHVKALANAVDLDILSLAKDKVGGTYGTTSAPNDKAAILGVNQKLDSQLCPVTGRNYMVDPATKSGLLSVSDLTLGNARSEMNPPVVTGNMGESFGFTFYMNQNISATNNPTQFQHTSGTVGANSTPANNSFLVNGAISAGAESMVVDGALAGGVLNEGTVIKFASLDQEFVVTGTVTLTGGAGTVTFSPALPADVADNVQVDAYKSYKIKSVAFHRNAFALAIRPFPEVPAGLGSIVSQIVDNETGLSLRLEITRTNNVTRFELQILYGIAAVRPEFAVKAVQFEGDGSFPA